MDRDAPSIRAFGAIELTVPGAGVVGSPQRQLLLAMLLAHRGTVVPVLTLAGALWPTRPPARVGKSLQLHVHRLRQRLGEIAEVRYQPPGYRLVVPDELVDIYLFEDLVGQGRAALAGGDSLGAVDRLSRALELYRGPAFQGLDDNQDLALESRRLTEVRLAATEQRIAAGLALGDHSRLVAELERLVATYPTRERFRAQLMTALHRCGRKADALAVYRSGRRFLVEELGVEPSEECRALERAILADDPALAPPSPGPPVDLVPRQLPPDVQDFTGRVDQLEWLDSLLATVGSGRSTATVITVVDGMAGVGKTALVIHWAHRVREHFPDGQLYVDLRGHSPGPPMRPIEALALILSALGVSGDELPGDEAATARYRSLVADRRLLVVLDNAAAADQVRPLMPGGDSCLVLVTARHHLAGLVAKDGARRLALDVFTPAEATALLATLLKPDRLAAEPGAAADLAELCGHLPLALRVAAASLHVGRRIRIGDWVAQLRAGDGLSALTIPDDPAATLTTALDLSYQRLPAAARRMLRLGGLVPEPELTAPAAAALADTDVGVAARLLAELATVHLLEEPTPGRYAFHDLVRRYAVQRATAEEPEPARTAARARLYDFYRRTTTAHQHRAW